MSNHSPMKLINTCTSTHTHHTRARAHTRTHTQARSKKFVLRKIRNRNRSRRLETMLKEMGFLSLSKWCLGVRMAESVWQTIPGRGNDMWEWSLTKCFGIRTRNLENACVCGGTEISRGSVKMKFGEVLWSSACNYTEAKRGDCVLCSCPDWKLV